MACEYKCGSCGGDGTRCGCPGVKRAYVPYSQTREGKIEKLEHEVKMGLRALRSFRR